MLTVTFQVEVTTEWLSDASQASPEQLAARAALNALVDRGEVTATSIQERAVVVLEGVAPRSVLEALGLLDPSRPLI